MADGIWTDNGETLARDLGIDPARVTKVDRETIRKLRNTSGPIMELTLVGGDLEVFVESDGFGHAARDIAYISASYAPNGGGWAFAIEGMEDILPLQFWAVNYLQDELSSESGGATPPAPRDADGRYTMMPRA